MKKNKYLILIIATVLFIIVGSTFAWLSYRSANTSMKLTIGSMDDVMITFSPYKINKSIVPSVAGYEKEPYSQIDVINNSGRSKNVTISYNINEIGAGLISEDFKYVILKSSNNITYTECSGCLGNFANASSNSTFDILVDKVSAGNTYYRVYLWFDGSNGNNPTTDILFNGELTARAINIFDYSHSLLIGQNSTKWLNTNIDGNMINSVTFSHSLEGHEVNNTNTFDVGNIQDGSILLWATNLENNLVDVTIGQNDGVVANVNSSNLFSWLRNLTTINFNNNFDTSNVTNMSNMFYEVSSGGRDLILHFDDAFDTSNVTDMSWMFSQPAATIVGNYNAVCNINLGPNFNTINVTNMYSMFSGFCVKHKDFYLDLGKNFDTSNVMDMAYMFGGDCILLKGCGPGRSASNFSINLGDKFNVSNVTNMYGMFGGFAWSADNFSLHLGDNFDTSNVTNMSQMFSNFGCNATNFSLSLGNSFNATKATNMAVMFEYFGSNATNFSLSLGNSFNSLNVTNMSSMFHGFGQNAINFSLDFGNNFNTAKVTDMSNMFGVSGLNFLNLSTFDINGAKLNDMFFNMKNLQTIITPRSFNTTNNTHFPRAFYDANDTAFTLLNSNIPLNTTLTYKEGDGTEYTTSEGGGSSSQCVTSDTIIRLADGTQKMVKDLTEDDLLLVWNLETGKYDMAPIVFIDSDPEDVYEVIRAVFSDGTYVDIISEHGFFDIDLGKYVYLDKNADKYIGDTFFKYSDNGWKEVKLVDVIIENKVVTPYSPVTYEHLNYFTNNMLSMPGGINGMFNILDVDTNTMTYDKFKYYLDINNYGLFTYDDFSDMLPIQAYNAFNGRYLKIAIGKGLITWKDIYELADRYVPLVK